MKKMFSLYLCHSRSTPCNIFCIAYQIHFHFIFIFFLCAQCSLLSGLVSGKKQSTNDSHIKKIERESLNEAKTNISASHRLLSPL